MEPEAPAGSTPERSSGPLDGVTVIELAAYLSGPFATMMLADLGAKVTKIETPKGDPFRRFRGAKAAMSPQFASVNRNKQSVVADLKSAAGRDLLLGLLPGADVLVTNWRPATAERLGLGDEAVSAANPRLIRCYLTGFGPDGPDADRPAFDPIIQAQAGLTEGWGAPDHPGLAPNYHADAVSSAMAVQAILAALLARERSGIGDRIDLAMLDAVSYFSFPGAMSHRTLLDHGREGEQPRNGSTVRPVRGSDGWLVIGAVTSAQLRGASAAVGNPDWAEDVLAHPDRPQASAEFLDRVESVTAQNTVQHWLETFAKHDVPAARCLSVDEHFEDEQVRHNELYTIEPWPGLGAVRQVRYPARYTTWPTLGYRTPAPMVGGHDDNA